LRKKNKVFLLLTLSRNIIWDPDVLASMLVEQFRLLLLHVAESPKKKKNYGMEKKEVMLKGLDDLLEKND
jgi:hypothetical protein